MILLARKSQKTEAKDGIYAILGLLDDLPSEGAQARLLEVNYRKPLATILQDVTRCALCQDGELFALRAINHTAETIDGVDFPTWVVRADQEERSSGLLRLPESFKASYGLGVPLLLEDTSCGHEVLLVEGLIANIILACTGPCTQHIWDDHKRFHSWLIFSLNMVPEPIKVLRSIALTLTAGKTDDWEIEDLKELPVLIRHLGILALNEEGVVPDAHITAIKDILRSNYCLQRRFFITPTGRMGLGPYILRPGDLVVILKGGPWPFILRNGNDGDYKLLGQTYVRGIMQGEVVDPAKPCGNSEVIFNIR